MKQVSAKSEIIRQYLLSYQEIAIIKFTLWNYNKKIDKVFSGNEEVKKILKNELENYINNVKIELKVLSFLLSNERKLYLTDIYNLLDIFDKNYEERFTYLQELIANLQTALDMEYIYKFYLPRNKPKYLNEQDYEGYITYAKGFNLKRIKEFLVAEEIYDENTLDEVLKNAKILDINVKENIDMFGIFDKGLIIPLVKDDLSSLIAIHELVHQALVSNKEKLNDDEISLGEELPIFYEDVFKKQNGYVNEPIREDGIILEMLEDYKEEGFEEQVNKLKKLKR